MITSVQRLPVFYTQLRKMERAESKTDCNPAPCLSREKPCLLFKQLHQKQPLFLRVWCSQNDLKLNEVFFLSDIR